MDNIQCRHAHVAGTAEGECLLAGDSDRRAQVALPKLPYTLEQLQQMQAAAAAIVASKADIRHCTVVLHDFPMAKYTRYTALQGCSCSRRMLTWTKSSWKQTASALA